ncbi:high affinity copper uptake protein 1-like [Culicoides brevitarsis]|uniref:high affinity copper uptake protein 1-like n=1 Tax=Culicoides brevitarsis TaxID=469753 RepID=UPI00307B115C
MGLETHIHEREDGGCPMIMLFHDGVCETNFFNSWTTTTVGPFVGVCFLLFFIAILFEGLKHLREKFYELESKNAKNLPQKQTFSQFLCSKYHLIQTAMHFVQVLCSYGLMLIFMNFNYWQCLAILVGFMAGYFLFGWTRKSATDTNECCY